MNRQIFAYTLLLAAMLMAAQSAFGAQRRPCARRETLVAQLADRWGETAQAIGLNGDALLELFASRETGTWTLALTGADGISCIIAAGTAFQTALPAPGTKDPDA